MTKRNRLTGIALLGVGLMLAGGAWVGGVSAAIAWLLTQPAMALGIGMLRGTRPTTGLIADTTRLLLHWTSAAVAAGVLLGGPLRWLLAQPSLGHALLLAAGAGLLLIGLWWHWPRLALLARAGHTPDTLRQQRTLAPEDWRGLLGVALPMASILTTGLLLAWPGLLTSSVRVLTLTIATALLPLLHLWLQRTVPLPTLHGLPVVEMPSTDPSADMPDDGVPEDTAPPDTAALTRELYAAARNGRVERALALLEAGADPHALPEADARDRRSLPMLAAVLPDLRLLRALIERGVDVNARQAGMTPLLAATRDSWHGRPDAVMMLLANGADPRQTDAEGNTPLHHAARSVDPGVTALLHDAGADLDACNHEGISPLGSACLIGNWRLARFLLERGARPDPPGGQPALLCAAACEDDDPAGVQLLLRHKARVDARDRRGRSALHEAAARDHVEICQALLQAHATVDARDAQGRTPLLEAVRAGATQAVALLLEAGADLHAVDAEGANALHLLCTAETPSLDLAGDLRDLGVDPHQPDAQGRTAIDLARAGQHWALLAVLDPRQNLSVLSSASPPDEQLHEALRTGAPLPQLLTLAALLTSEQLSALLMDDAAHIPPPLLAWMLQHGANPEAGLHEGRAPVWQLLAQGEPAIPALQCLFAAGASPAGAGTLARFLAACLAHPVTPAAEAFALELLDRGADPFAHLDHTDPTLVLTVRLGWKRLLLRLLEQGLNPTVGDAHGMTPLHHAAATGRADLVQTLVRFGAAPDQRAADGQTPLGIALSCGRRDLADWLDWRSWRPPRRALIDADVPAAAIAGDLDAVRRLLALGLPVNAVDHQGGTALLHAAGSGHTALVAFLLAQGGDPTLAARTGATPLSAAVSMSHPEIVDLLLCAGCALEQRLPGGITVLMLASALGLPDMVARLLHAGADLHARDDQGLTALHCAAIYGFTARERPRLMALLDTLLLGGADPNARTRSGLTPLLLLLGARAEPGTPTSEDILLGALQRLLDEDVTLDVRDPRGLGPLHLAALHGLQRVARLLLDAGADPALRDTFGRTARDIAQLRGYVDVAAELASGPTPPPPGTVSMARFLRE